MGIAKLFSWIRPAEKTRRSFAKRSRVRLQLETLEDREVLTFNPTGYEQELLELLNRMRMDPQGELRRLLTSTNPVRSADPSVQAALQYFNVSGSTLTSQWSKLTPAQPLAWNEGLANASRAHTQAMISADQQSHQLPGEAPLGTRMTQGGYRNWTAGGENVYAYATSVAYAHAGFAIDWGYGPGGIQSPAGHRLNMMNKSFREVGITVMAENNPSTEVGPFVVTQDFGNRSNLGNSYLLGVAYNDADRDGRYDAGEGLGNVVVSITGPGGSFRTTTMSAGGYQVQLPSGSYSVTFSGGGLASPISKSVTIGSANVKLDALPSGSPGGGTPGGGTPGGGGGTATNRAPVLNANYNAILSSIAEDAANPAGNTVAQIVGTSISDPDAGSLRGIAVIGANSTNGAWQFSLDSGKTWNALTGTAATSARLLRDTDRVRFIPQPNFSGTASITYRAWDRKSGSVGGVANLSSAASVGGSTAFSVVTDSAFITITPANDAPVLNTNRNFTFSPVYRDGRIANNGTLVSALVGTAILDVDAGAKSGIAVTGLGSTTRGTWQFSLDNGKTWTNFGGTSNAAARLLRLTDRIRFVPQSSYSGVVTMQFRAWDQSSGIAGRTANLVSRWGALVGGATAYSAASGTGTLTVY